MSTPERDRRKIDRHSLLAKTMETPLITLDRFQETSLEVFLMTKTGEG